MSRKKGFKHSKETRKRISIARKGIKFSDKHRKNLSKSHKGKFTGFDSPHWKGIRKHSAGYILIYKPEHPFCDHKGYVFEHRLVMEEKVGRYLTLNEIAHHINGVRNDNRPENLELLTKFIHKSYHGKILYPKGSLFGANKIYCNKYM